jgi:hypothetical protein
VKYVLVVEKVALAAGQPSNTSFSAVDHNSNDAVYSPRIFAPGQRINQINKFI